MLKALILATAISSFYNCSGSKPDEISESRPPNKEKLIQILTLFVEAVQGDQFEKAISFLTPSERSKMTDASGQTPAIIKRQLKALRLSTLAQKAGVKLEQNKLEGIFEWLPQIETQPHSQPTDTEAPLIQ